MTQYHWYRIFNAIEFAALDLVSKTYTLNLEAVGEVDILVTQGNFLGMTYDGIFLALGIDEKNPFEFDGHAAYKNEETGDVYLGLPVIE